VIKGLIFDFDGLILDTEVPEFDAWQQIFKSHGGILEFEKWASIVGTSPESFDVISDLERQIGKKVNRGELKAIHFSTAMAEIEKKGPLPGVTRYLEDAHKMGIKVGLASSSNREWVHSHLSRLHLMEYFNCICVSENVQKVKPEPELYLLAMKKLGLEPKESIAFEDSPNGIQAAKNAGMICVAVPNAFTRNLNLSRADFIFDSLEEINLGDLITYVEEKIRSN